MSKLIEKVEGGMTALGVNCHKGRHRSVGFAELAKKELENLGYTVVLKHLEL